MRLGPPPLSPETANVPAFARTVWPLPSRVRSLDRVSAPWPLTRPEASSSTSRSSRMVAPSSAWATASARVAYWVPSISAAFSVWTPSSPAPSVRVWTCPETGAPDVPSAARALAGSMEASRLRVSSPVTSSRFMCVGSSRLVCRCRRFEAGTLRPPGKRAVPRCRNSAKLLRILSKSQTDSGKSGLKSTVHILAQRVGAAQGLSGFSRQQETLGRSAASTEPQRVRQNALEHPGAAPEIPGGAGPVLRPGGLR